MGEHREERERFKSELTRSCKEWLPESSFHLAGYGRWPRNRLICSSLAPHHQLKRWTRSRPQKQIKRKKNPSKSNPRAEASSKISVDLMVVEKKRIVDVPDLDKSESVGRNRGDARSDDRLKLMWLASGRGAERRGYSALAAAVPASKPPTQIKPNQNQTARRKSKAKQPADSEARGGLHTDHDSGREERIGSGVWDVERKGGGAGYIYGWMDGEDALSSF